MQLSHESRPVDFRSDNCGRAAPELIEALVAANEGTALGYGGDPVTGSLQECFAALFETPVRVYPVPTGTAANALALAAAGTPFGAVYCSPEAHVNTSECNATSFFGGGTKLVPVAGPHGKVDAAELARSVVGAGKGLAHKSQPAAVNLVQASDLGAVYSIDEIEAVSAVAREHGLKVHMDGARFANAIATLGCTPAQVKTDGACRLGREHHDRVREQAAILGHAEGHHVNARPPRRLRRRAGDVAGGR